MHRHISFLWDDALDDPKSVTDEVLSFDPCDSLRSHARFPLTKIPQSLRDSSLYKGAVVFECQCVESFLPRDDVQSFDYLVGDGASTSRKRHIR